MYGAINQLPKEVECQGWTFLSLLELNQAKPVVEPKTGIEFPLILDNILTGEKNYSNSEVYILYEKLFSHSFGLSTLHMNDFCAPCSCSEVLVKIMLLDTLHDRCFSS